MQANLVIAFALLWPTCVALDPCAPNNPLQVDEDVKKACEAEDGTGGEEDDDLGAGDLALILPMPSLVTPDYGFLDIDNPPAGFVYDEIALEEQRFAFSCAGAAPGVNNCAIGEETEFSRELGIAMCPNWIGTWEMPEADPGWLDGIPGNPMTVALCNWGPPDNDQIICSSAVGTDSLPGSIPGARPPFDRLHLELLAPPDQRSPTTMTAEIKTTLTIDSYVRIIAESRDWERGEGTMVVRPGGDRGRQRSGCARGDRRQPPGGQGRSASR